MYIVLFACACDKRAVVTATHYILHMFFLFCTRFACSQCMLQDLGLAEDCDVSTSGIKNNFADGTGIETCRSLMRNLLVRLYLHPHDARTLHLSFDV
jgi:hypothetical protein